MGLPIGADTGPGRNAALVESGWVRPPAAPGEPPARPDWRLEDRGQAAGGRHHDALHYWRILVRGRWVIVGALAVCLALGVAATLLTPPDYSAAATLQIDRESPKIVNGEDQTPSDNLASGDEFFQTQYGLLKSRSLATRVADALGLARTDAFVRTMSGGTPRLASPADRLAGVTDALRRHLEVNPVRGSRLVEVAFDSPDPALSARIAIAAGLDRQFEGASYARDFLERRLEEVKAKLEDSERALVDYATSQQIIPLAGGQANSPDTAQSLAGANMEALNAALASATAERIRAEQRWRQSQSGPGDATEEALQNPTVQQISQQRAKLLAEYQDKLSVYKPDYPDMRQLQAQIDETNRQLAQQTDRIRSSLAGQYQIALKNEQSLTQRVEALKGKVLDLRARSIRYTILQREVDTNRTLYAGLLQRYKEVSVAGGLAANNVSIVDRAVAPIVPTRPKPALNLLLAALAGLGLGVGLAFAREALDQAVRAPADIAAVAGLPLLGVAPSLKKGQRPRDVLADARSPLVEAYQSLRSALQFSTADGFPRTLLITSPGPGGGKSTTALAIGQNLARLGFRALVVDADLRKPSLHGLFDVDSRVGLSNVLTGAASVQQAAQAVADQPNLFVVTSGPLPPNPADLLAGIRLKQFIDEASLFVDMVIFDGPPIMGLADAPLLGAAVAGTLLVVEAGKTSRGELEGAVRRLAMSNAHVLGALLTRCTPPRGQYGYGYAYGYGAGGEASAELGLAGLKAMLARARRAVAA
jgi:capsular exopolysaccharide synthesis family protein